jgi:hypothetical protein
MQFTWSWLDALARHIKNHKHDLVAPFASFVVTGFAFAHDNPVDCGLDLQDEDTADGRMLRCAAANSAKEIPRYAGKQRPVVSLVLLIRVLSGDFSIVTDRSGYRFPGGNLDRSLKVSGRWKEH